MNWVAKNGAKRLWPRSLNWLDPDKVAKSL